MIVGDEGIAWQCMAMHGNAWQCMAMHGNAWQCVAMHGNKNPPFSRPLVSPRSPVHKAACLISNVRSGDRSSCVGISFVRSRDSFVGV